MLFKQNISKEEKIKFLIGIIGVSAFYVAILVIALIQKNDLKLLILFSFTVFLPLLIVMVLIGLRNLEFFYIYNDRIEARSFYGRKNIVYFKNILFVQQVSINLTTRGMKRTFYMFNDGRKDNNNMFNINSCYNNKKFNLRIYKTPVIENYVNEILKLKVI